MNTFNGRLFERARFKTRYFSFYRILCFTFVVGFLYMLCDVSGFLLTLQETSYSDYQYPLETNFQSILEAVKKGENPGVNPINNYPYKYNILNDDKCLDSNTSEQQKVDLLLIIKSAVHNSDRRHAIRNTWGSEDQFSDLTIRRVFFLGTEPSDPDTQNKIKMESKIYKDIVQADFLDTYHNNTIKTMMEFKWVTTNCPNARYILLSDDDMYISIKNLYNYVTNPSGLRYNEKTESSFKHFLAGYVFDDYGPIRFKLSKWFIPIEDYPFSLYPPYIPGCAFVMNFATLQDLYLASSYVRHFKFDDVYLGIVSKKLDIELLHSEQFYRWKLPYERERYRQVIASHGYHDPDELMAVWKDQQALDTQ